jgi:hypothetical protein
MGKLADLLRKEAQADHQTEVARLVDSTNEQMRPSRSAFSDAVGADQANNAAKIEDQAVDWLREQFGAQVGRRTGLAAEAQKHFPRLSDAAAMRAVKKARDLAASENRGNYIRRQNYF